MKVEAYHRKSVRLSIKTKLINCIRKVKIFCNSSNKHRRFDKAGNLEETKCLLRKQSSMF